MKMNVIENKRNELMKRNEIKAEVEEKTIPSRQEIRKILTAKVDSKEEKVVVKKIESKFGQQKFVVIANAYDSEEDLKKAESKYVLKRNTFKKETEEGTTEKSNEEIAEKAEEKKEEPVKENNEEAKTEEKK